MWMTPFYLFFGTLLVYVFQKYIIKKNYKNFIISFLILFLLSPITYAYVSITETNKRTDYPGKQIAKKVQMRWDKEFKEPINVVLGNEWNAGNLSYHLSSRPAWFNDIKGIADNISEDQGVIYVGNPEILKKICPGVFGEIKPTGYCMIGKKYIKFNRVNS